MADIQAELATAFRRTFGRSSDVFIDITERLPVYVIGTVRVAGTLKYLPGMVVLQALAHAGGMDYSNGDTARTIEFLRQAELLRQAEDRLSRLAVKRARLLAMRNNLDAFEVPESVRTRLAAATPHDGLTAVIEGEAATLTTERRGRWQQLALADQQLGIARAEVDAVRKRDEQLRSLLAWKSTKLHELEQVAARGSLPQFKLTETNGDIADVSARIEDNHVALTQAERRLAEAEIARARVELEEFG